MCPICQHPGATVATLYFPREESSNSDVSTIVDCPSCGTLIDGEVDQALLPSVLVVDEEEQVVCPI